MSRSKSQLHVMGPANNVFVADYFQTGEYPDVDAFRDAQIWRYCSVENLVDLVSQEQLYVPRGDQFADRYEGVVCFTEEIDGEEHRRFARSRYSADYYISCWHLNSSENLSWWERYGQGKRVAIVSTVRRLIQAMQEKKQEELFHIMAAQVEYLPMVSRNLPIGRELADWFEPFSLKDSDFRHEREFRLIGRTSHADRAKLMKPNPHVLLNVDCKTLIDKVVVSPFCSESEREFIIGGVGAISPDTDVSPSQFQEIFIDEELDFTGWTGHFKELTR